MSEPINLNRARKDKAKAEARASAGQNRVRFGRPKAQSAIEARLAEKAAQALDGAKREP